MESVITICTRGFFPERRRVFLLLEIMTTSLLVGVHFNRASVTDDGIEYWYLRFYLGPLAFRISSEKKVGI